MRSANLNCVQTVLPTYTSGKSYYYYQSPPWGAEVWFYKPFCDPRSKASELAKWIVQIDESVLKYSHRTMPIKKVQLNVEHDPIRFHQHLVSPRQRYCCFQRLSLPSVLHYLCCDSRKSVVFSHYVAFSFKSDFIVWYVYMVNGWREILENFNLT